MPKYAIRIIASVLVISLATLVISQRLSIAKLQRDIQNLREQHEQIPEPAVDNAGISTPITEVPRAETQPNESSLELLRLRGEVGRLRLGQNEVEQLRQENARLYQEIRAIRGPMISDVLAKLDFDTNGVLRIEPGASTKLEVLEELRRVGATVLDENEEFIHAILGSTTGAVNTVTLECHFADGKLTTSRLIQKDFKRRTPSPFE